MANERQEFIARKDIHIAIGLFILAAAIRFIYLNAGLWYTDAVIAAQKAEATFSAWTSGNFTVFYMHGVGYPGNVITIAIIYGIFKLIGGAVNAEFATLFSSLFFGSLTVGLLYLLVKKFSDSFFAAISAALVLNFLPVYLSTSTFGMSHQIASFFIVLSFYLALFACERDDRTLKILAGASLGWASAIRLESLQMIPLTLFFYWMKKPPIGASFKEGYFKFKTNQKKELIAVDLLYFIVPAAILLLIPYTPMLLSSGAQPLIDAFEYNRWLGLWVPGLTETVIGWVTISMTKLGWLLAFAGLIALVFRKNKSTFIVMLLWCAFFLVLANTKTVEDRHSMPALVGLSVAIAFGLELAYRKLHPIAGILLLLLLIGWMSYTIYPILEYRAGFCGPKAFAYTVKDTVEPNSIVIVMDEGPHLEYYGKLNTMDHPYDGDDAKFQKSMNSIEGYISNRTNVYIISTAFVYDTGDGLSYDSRSGTLSYPAGNRAYSNLVFNPQEQSITDKKTGVKVALYGRWQAELFQRFMVTPVKTVENEDWHKKSVMFGKFDETLFRISEREQ